MENEFKILAQNIKNNPDDFSAEQIEKYFNNAFTLGKNKRVADNPVIAKWIKTTDEKELADFEARLHKSFEFTENDTKEHIAYLFGCWLNQYFEVWNSDSDVWIDGNHNAWTTKELHTEFVNVYKK